MMMKKMLAICMLVLMVAVSAYAEDRVTVTNKEMTLQLSIGKRTGVYTGEVKDNLPDGTGTFVVGTDENGWTYTGDWVNGHMEGNGSTTFAFGSVVTGKYVNDDMVLGKLYADGILRYEGEVKDENYHGKGIFYYPNGNVAYDGVTAKGTYNGAGKYYYANGKMAYEGTFLNNYYSGHGKLYNGLGELVLEGEFKDGAPAEIEKYKQLCSSDPFEQLVLNPYENCGKFVTYSGKIVAAEQLYNGEICRYTIEMDGTAYKANVYQPHMDGKGVFAVEDEVAFWGVFMGNDWDAEQMDGQPNTVYIETVLMVKK